MKNILKACSISLIIFTLFLSCTITGFTFQKIDNDTAIKITGIRRLRIDVLEIPSYINNLPVTVIGESAFERKVIKKVIFAPTIISIEDYAFTGNQIQEIVLPENITHIGKSAFSGNQIQKIVLPENITHIGNSAFSWNQIQEIVLPDTLTNIGEFAFSENRIETLIIPSSVSTIGGHAFSRNRINNLILPENITKIGTEAFSNNQLTNVVIPYSIPVIEYGVFWGNKFTSIIIPENITQIQGPAFKNNDIREIIIGENVVIQDNSFDSNFHSFYISNRRKAGTYIFHNNRWRFSTTEEYQLRYGSTTEQEFGKILEPYIGYHFLVWSPPNLSNTGIVKLFLQDDLFMQRITIENNELVEGEKILLDNIYDNLIGDYPSLTFRNDNRQYRIYINAFNTEHENIYIYSNDQRLNNNLFAKNTNEVLELYSLFFTEEAQKRYVGNFIFSEYQIIQNTTEENPFEDIEGKEISIGFENGNLFINNSYNNIYNSFIIHNNAKTIFGERGNGTFISSSRDFYYQDENTIIERSSFDRSTDDESGRSETLQYRVIFKRAPL